MKNHTAVLTSQHDMARSSRLYVLERFDGCDRTSTMIHTELTILIDDEIFGLTANAIDRDRDDVMVVSFAVRRFFP